MDITWIGQHLYFGPHIPTAIAGHTTRFVEYAQGVQDPETLRGLTAGVIFYFRGEHIPHDILDSMRGVKVMISTEPVPQVAGKRTIITTDRAQRMADLMRAGNFDFRFHFDKTSLQYLKEHGRGFDGDFVLPINIKQLGGIVFESANPEWDVLLAARDTTYRRMITTPLKHTLGARFCHVAHGFSGSNLRYVADQSRIGLNIHVDGNPSLEPRVPLLMALGLMVISEPLSDNDLYKPGIHYIEVPSGSPASVHERVMAFLKSPDDIERIARAGRQLVKDRLDASKVWLELTKRVTDKARSQA